MLKVANIFSNDMVLQRDKNITVWGLGDEERTVTVTLNGVSVQTQVCDGRWTAVLPPMSAGGEHETGAKQLFDAISNSARAVNDKENGN